MGRRQVILVGLSGAGKTTVGRLVATALGGPFLDLDDEVQRRAGKTMPEIFREDGEPAFRALEAACGRDAFGGAAAVVAVGGGFFEDAANRQLARTAGMAVYLRVAPATAAARLGGGGGRPLLENGAPAARLADLLARREAGYLTADHVVETDGATADAVAGQVASLARGHGGW